jgi:hypothetical protein
MKRPKLDRQPIAKKQPKGTVAISSNGERICWGIGRARLDGPFSWQNVTRDILWNDLHPYLKSLETMTWDEILKASGGRSRGNNNHDVDVDQLGEEAKRDLTDAGVDDVDKVFSLRVNARMRIWGIREGRVLSLLWFDPEHMVYPV